MLSSTGPIQLGNRVRDDTGHRLTGSWNFVFTPKNEVQMQVAVSNMPERRRVEATRVEAPLGLDDEVRQL